MITNGTIKFSRTWAMPNRWTFAIRPIADLLARYVKRREDWIDPFAGFNSPAWYTNDLNPKAPTNHHLDAEEFVGKFEEIRGILFDPPYSPRQMSECYKSIGMKVGMKETQNATLYARVRNAAAPKVKPGALAISFGWNSGGFGQKRGFEIVEIMLVCHGAGHNDTIVTVERKVIGDLFT